MNLNNQSSDWGLQKNSSKYGTGFFKSFGTGVAATAVIFRFSAVHQKSGIAISFSPAKFCDDDWSSLREMLDALVAGGRQKLLKSYTLSLIEFAIDVRVPFDELVCIAPGAVVENLNYLEKGTRYLGQKDSARTFCIYDKRKQLAEKAKVDLGHDLVRIEVRLKHLKLRIDELGSISDPFGKLLAIRKTALTKLCGKYSDDPVLIKFWADIAAGESPQGAYLKLSKGSRKALLTRLREGSLKLNGKCGADPAWIKDQSAELLANFSEGL